jgi:hypothetical protein
MQTHQSRNRSHETMGLSKSQPKNDTQRQAYLNRQIRVPRLTPTRLAARRIPYRRNVIGDPDHQSPRRQKMHRIRTSS